MWKGKKRVFDFRSVLFIPCSLRKTNLWRGYQDGGSCDVAGGGSKDYSRGAWRQQLPRLPGAAEFVHVLVPQAALVREFHSLSRGREAEKSSCSAEMLRPKWWGCSLALEVLWGCFLSFRKTIS